MSAAEFSSRRDGSSGFESSFAIPPDHIDLDRERLDALVLRTILFTFVSVWYVVWLLMLAIALGWVRPEFLGLRP